MQERHENKLVNQYDQNENIFSWNYMSIVVWFQRAGFKIIWFYIYSQYCKLTMGKHFWETAFVTVAVKLCSFFVNVVVFHELKVEM